MQKPRQTGYYKTSDSHDIYWEIYGREEGLPVICLHGGPGGGRDEYLAEYCDLNKFQILMFDQRGCGLSKASNPFLNNTIAYSIQDIQALQKLAGFGPSIIFGGSWGATLALEYAKTCPQDCMFLMLYSIFLGRPQDEKWFLYDVKSIVPDIWEKLVANLDASELNNIAAAYKQRISSAEKAVWSKATADFLNYMKCLLKFDLEQGASLKTAGQVTQNDRQSVLIFLHYSTNNYFLDAKGALKGIEAIRSIPGKIIHGRHDLDTPLTQAYELHKAWPASSLQIIPDCGHSDTEPSMKAAISKAFAELDKLL